jgi:hydrogenase expression/formation protein HypC
MCLGIPGEIVEIEESAEGLAHGTVSFGGVRKRICLAYVPEAKVGDYAVVHAGFALNLIDEKEAEEVFALLEQIERLEAPGLPGGEAVGGGGAGPGDSAR